MKFKCAECDKTLKTTIDESHGPSIGICGHTGATWETIAAVLDTWSVTVYTRDGNTSVGEFRNYADHDDTFTLVDLEDGLTYKEEIPFDTVVHIQIN